MRQVDKNNYRCNESVLQKQDAKFKQISVPQEDFGDYVTDAGLVVPAITPRLRQHIFSLAETAGLSFARQSELIGRACTETALHLLGGNQYVWVKIAGVSKERKFPRIYANKCKAKAFLVRFLFLSFLQYFDFFDSFPSCFKFGVFLLIFFPTLYFV